MSGKIAQIVSTHMVKGRFLSLSRSKNYLICLLKHRFSGHNPTNSNSAVLVEDPRNCILNKHTDDEDVDECFLLSVDMLALWYATTQVHRKFSIPGPQPSNATRVLRLL